MTLLSRLSHKSPEKSLGHLIDPLVCPLLSVLLVQNCYCPSRKPSTPNSATAAAQGTYTTLHYTTLHYTTLHYTTLHYTTLHYTTLHYTTLHYTTLHYTTLYYTTLHYTTLIYTTLRLTSFIHFIACM